MNSLSSGIGIIFYTQFTREQLAGDLLPNPTVDQQVATAFNKLTRTSVEGGIQPKQYLAKYAADRVRTLSTVWMGSSSGDVVKGILA